MNENNVNQTQNAGNGYPKSGQPFPQSEQPYPQSSYPQSGMPYPQSSYPQSDMPYPMSGYAEGNKSKTWQIAIVSVVAVLIVALATTLIVVLQKKKQQGGMMPPPPPPMGTIISVSENGSTINGQPATIDFFTESGKAYLKLEDISSTAGYDFVREGNQVKLLSQLELAILEVGSTEVTLQDQTTKSTTSVEILKAPFEKEGDVYIYARDLSVFMKKTNVSYNSATGSVDISIDSGMGGPGGPPPGGMPQQGQQPFSAPQQNEAVTEGKKESSGKEQETKSADDKQESRPQPTQGGPGGPPPQINK